MQIIGRGEKLCCRYKTGGRQCYFPECDCILRVKLKGKEYKDKIMSLNSVTLGSIPEELGRK